MFGKICGQRRLASLCLGRTLFPIDYSLDWWRLIGAIFLFIDRIRVFIIHISLFYSCFILVNCFTGEPICNRLFQCFQPLLYSLKALLCIIQLFIDRSSHYSLPSVALVNAKLISIVFFLRFEILSSCYRLPSIVRRTYFAHSIH